VCAHAFIHLSLHMDSCAHVHTLGIWKASSLLRDCAVGDFSSSLFLYDERGMIMLFAGCLFNCRNIITTDSLQPSLFS
jgi:hypothetical protein